MDAARSVVMDQHKRIQGATLFLNQRNKNYPVFKGVNTIGRNKSAVIDIKDLSISQCQAIIVIVDDNQHFLSDLNSSNGTFLHGTKLVPFKLYELTHDADIIFGNISGRYLKPSHLDTTVHLNITDTIDMTQNMTQNFYAATTQLMFDTTSVDHEFVRPKSRDNQSSVIPPKPVQPSPIGLTSSSESILEENIHDMATQVVEYPEKMSVGIEPIQYQEVEHSIVDNNIHDQPTQVVVFPQSMETMQDDIENVDKSMNKINLVSTQVTEPAAKDSGATGTSKLEHLVHVSTEVEIRKNINHPESRSQIDSQTTNIDVDEDYMENLKVQNVNSRNTLHSSQIPSTSGVGQACEVNDSLVSNITSDNVIVEETMIDENITGGNFDDSNGSVDLLTMPVNDSEDDGIIHSASPNKHEKLSQNDGSSQDIVKSKKKMPQKLNSDSETDFDETQDIGIRKKSIVRINSDSETDCEDNVSEAKILSKPEESPLTPTQNIKPVVKSKKMNFDSDSDTDVENEDNIEKTALSKSTKCAEKLVNSGSDTDIEDSKPEENRPKHGMNNMNDSDCIPATQDAFAEAFKYKSNLEDTSGHHSSEESFKLGLTELMVDEEHSEIQTVEQKGIGKNAPREDNINSLPSPKDVLSKDKNDGNYSLENSKKKTDKVSLKTDYKENIYDLPTQTTQTDEETIKCTKNVSKVTNNDTFQENLMDQSDDFILPTQNLCLPNKDSLHAKKFEESLKTKSSLENNTEKPEMSQNKDIYDLPTQNLCTRSEDKLTEQSEDFILATQKLPDVSVDEYMMPTQKINSESQFKVPSKKFTFKKKSVVLEDSMSNILISDNDDDVYMAATQKMEINQKLEEKEDNDVYIQPTQCINIENKNENKNINVSAEEDVYILATQQLECNITANDISKGNIVNQELEDTYSLPTQVISNEVNSNSQSELIAITENIKMPPPPDFHRPKNPLNRVLNLNKTHSELPSSNKRINADQMHSPNQKRLKTTKLCQLKMKTEDAETLSQIEAFVNKPLIKCENNIEENKNSSTGSLIDNVKKDDVEIKTRNSIGLEKSSMENNAETLSQIEAFVKNPTERVQEISKSKKDLMKKMYVNKSEKAVEVNISNDDVVTNMSGSKHVAENVEENVDKNKTTMDDTTEVDLMENSTDLDKDLEIRSDIDQSFALLESKISKVKRNSRMHADLGQIIVVPLNRRSMAIAETSENDDAENTLPSRKSRRMTANNIQTTKAKAAPIKSRKKSVADSLTSDIPTKKSRVSIQEKKFPGLADVATLKSEDLADFSIAPHKKSINKTNPSTSVIKIDDKEAAVSAKLNNLASKQTTKEKVIKTINVNSTTSKITKRQSRRTRNISENKNEDIENNNQEHQKIDNRTSAEPSTSDESAPKVAARGSRKTRITEQLSAINKDSSNTLLEKNKSKSGSRTKTQVSCEASIESTLKIETPIKSKRSSARSDVQSHVSTDEFSTPTRRQGNNTLDCLTSSAERAKRKQKHKVVFTMMDNPHLESSIRQIGGSVVDSVDSSTVLITQQVKRSQKLLTAVGQGKPICSPEWIEASKKNRDFLDPWDFILIDKEAESRWNFSLKESLQRASETKLLRNYSFQIMASNAVEVLKSAIESCGGKVLSRNPGKKMEGTFVIIASPEQRSKYSKLLKQHPNVKVVEPEAIFDGVLRQELQLSKHLLT